MDNKDCIRVLLYSDYTTITGWGVLLRYTSMNYVGSCLLLIAKKYYLYWQYRHASS